MKLAVDLTSLAWNYSGIEQYAANVTRSLVEQHPEHSFILLFQDRVFRDLEDIAPRSNTQIVLIDGDKSSKVAFSQVKLARALRTIDADAYLFCALPAPLSLPAKNAVTVIHDVSFFDCPETMTQKSVAYWRASSKHAVKGPVTITVSEFSKARIHERLKVPHDRIVVAYNGVSERFFVSRDDLPDDRELSLRKRYNIPDRFTLSLCTLEPRKNLPFLIRAWEEARKADDDVPDLVLAGRAGWKMDKLTSAVPEDLTDSIHFTGFIDNDDLPYLYSLSTCFVCPSIYEGFGLPPLEALASGAKVLVSDIEVFHETCRDEVAFFALDDTTSLSKLLGNLDAIPTPKPTRQFWDRFRWETSANTILSAIERAVG